MTSTALVLSVSALLSLSLCAHALPTDASLIAQQEALNAPVAAETKAAPPAPSPAASEAKALMEATCGACHDLGMVTNVRQSREEWALTVDRMISFGAPLGADEEAKIIDYLAATYGPAEDESQTETH